MHVDDKSVIVIFVAILVLVFSTFLQQEYIRGLFAFYVPIVSIIIIAILSFIDDRKNKLKKIATEENIWTKEL